MTAKSLVMKTGKIRPGTTVTRLISAWVWPLVILMLLRAGMVIQRTPFKAIIPLSLVHTLSNIIIITETEGNIVIRRARDHCIHLPDF